MWPLLFWELFRWDRPLKWAGPERYKDIISIMQMSGNVPSLGMRRAAVLSSLPLFPPPQVRRHPKIPEVFQHCTRRLPFHICPLDCPEEKIPEGPKTFGAYSLMASCTGPGLLAAGKSFSLRKSRKGCPCGPDLPRARGAGAADAVFAPGTAGPLDLGSSSSSGPDPW